MGSEGCMAANGEDASMLYVYGQLIVLAGVESSRVESRSIRVEDAATGICRDQKSEK
jgi:hypothetical protein